jgi:hypothetical protein
MEMVLQDCKDAPKSVRKHGLWLTHLIYQINGNVIMQLLEVIPPRIII